MEQRKLVVVLADISGYTQFMLENRTAAVHGQLCIDAIIESMLAHVDIPLVLQEIEGDAVFLYAVDPGEGADWQRIVEQVAAKLGEFFDTFIAQFGVSIESTPCQCAICRNADKLGIKIVAHAGEATFHEVAGRSQVSGPDVILAHRLLKNSIDQKSYLLLTEAAYELMEGFIPGNFVESEEECEGFGIVPVRVRSLEQDFLQARDAIYALGDDELLSAVKGYTAWALSGSASSVQKQLRNPIRPFRWYEKLLMVYDLIRFNFTFRFYHPDAIFKRQRARGKRRTFQSAS